MKRKKRITSLDMVVLPVILAGFFSGTVAQAEDTHDADSSSVNATPVAASQILMKKREKPYTLVSPGGYIVLPPPDLGNKNAVKREEYVNFPLTPEEIEQIRRKRMATERAKSIPLIRPSIKTRTIQFSFDAGTPMPTIRVSPGFVSSITFVDASGEPWPLSDAPVVGDKNGFSVIMPKNAKNILNVSALKLAGETTLSVILKGKPVPLVIKLVISDKVHDARVDLLAAGVVDSVKSKTDAGGARAIPLNVSTEMLDFVSGVPPKGAIELKTSSGVMRAWKFRDFIYIRTNRRLVSPDWIEEAHGVGVNVYKLQPAPWVLYSEKGEIKTAKIDMVADGAVEASISGKEAY